MLPSSLDDYVTADNPVRVIEVLIDEVDLGALGFTRFARAATGRPAYDPATLLKLDLYGYLNRVPSGQRLERDARRNMEVMVLTHSGARSMTTSGRGTSIVGDNVQIAVDPDHHLVVAHEVVNEGRDRTQLRPMGERAKQAIDVGEVVVLADRGDYSGGEVLVCEGAGILPAMPRADTLGRARKGHFVRADVVYNAAADHYVCPAGAVLTKSAACSALHGDIEHNRNRDACHA